VCAAIFLSPHKSLHRICEEYGVELREEDCRRLADAAFKAVEGGNMRELILIAKEIGERHGLGRIELKSFIYDLCRAAVFYVKALKAIDKALGGAEAEGACR